MSGASITIKWTSCDKEIYRSKVVLDDIFPYWPVLGHGAQVCTAASVQKSLPTDKDVLVEIRLSGSKDYIPLSSVHRLATVEAGRARLRFSYAEKASAVSATQSADDSLFIQSFLDAGSTQLTDSRKPRSTLSTAFEDFMEDNFRTAEVSSVAGLVGDVQGPSTITATTRPLTDKTDVVELVTSRISDLLTAKINDLTVRLEGKMSQIQIPPISASAVRGTPEELSLGSEKANIKTPSSQGKDFHHNAICDTCDKHIIGTRYKCLECPDYDACKTCWEDLTESHATHRFVKCFEDSLIPARSSRAIQIHAGVLCDGPLCSKKRSPITGDRYKCAICADYDLCSSCEANPDCQHNQTHPMIKMKVPVDRVSVSFEHTPAGQEVNGTTPGPDHVTADTSAATRSAQSSHHSFQNNTLQARLRAYAEASARNQPAIPASEIRDAMSQFGANIRKAMDVRKESNASEEAGRAVKHLTVACDGCDQMIHGSRFMCATCPDFDLCKACYDKSDHPNNHVFVRFNHFINNMVHPRLQFPAVPVHQGSGKHIGFYCNSCKRCPIEGKRFNCLTCKDYDRCAECAEKPGHPANHAMKIIPAVTNKTSVVPKAATGLDATRDGSWPGSGSQKSLPVYVETISDETDLWKGKTPEEQKTSEKADSVISLPKGCAAATTEDSASDLNHLSSEFVEDVSIPDGSIIQPDTSFVKQWLLKNNGTVPWPRGVRASFAGGLEMRSKIETAEPVITSPELETALLPGESTVVSVCLQAPKTETSNVISYWQLTTAAGHRFGCKLWIDIDIKNVAEASEDLLTVADETANVAASKTIEGSSEMIFPSASTELPKPGPFSNDTVSVASQRGQGDDETWGSEDEVELSDDDDYDVLDDESFTEDS